MVAIVVRENGNDTYYYTYTDHLGSILTVTNSGGGVVAEQSFDAWGRYRDVNTWGATTTAPSGGVSSWLTRGYTGHEHLRPFGLVNMNGRLYDPALGRMLSVDNYVVGLGTQAHNRYTYVLNNPLKYTDPSGEFLNLAFFGMAFTADYISNLLNGVNNPAQTAFKNSSRALNGLSNSFQIPIYSKGNTSISVGLNPLALGVSINFSQTSGDFTYGFGANLGFLTGFNFSGGISYSNGDWSAGINAGGGSNYYAVGGNVGFRGLNLGYYQTHYGEAMGPDGIANNQVVGGVRIGIGDFSFRLENDFLAFDDKDRWRSNAVEIGIGNFVLGTSLYNNDPEGERQDIDRSRRDRMGNLNTRNFGTWEHGKVYNSPLWVGYRFGNTIDRVGYSHPMVQDRTQNWVHRNGFFYLPFGHQNFYVDDSQFRYGAYLFTGFYNPFSLWGR